MVMTRFVYTQEMIDYVRKVAPGRFNKEIAELFNRRFGLDKTASQINSMKSNHGITSGNVRRRKRPHLRLFTEEQEQFVKENVKGVGNKELTEMVNKEFRTNYTVNQVKALKQRRGWSSELTGYFEKGHKTWNKGKKGLYFKGSEKGWFKKGQRPQNYRPVGSERICSKDGYILVKVQDEGTYPERWRHKHVVEWEKHNGKVPKGHVVTFLDGDKTNTDISNLKLIDRRTLSYLNRGDGLTDNPTENKVRINVAKLDSKISELSYTKGDRDKYEQYLKIARENGIPEETFKARIRRGLSFEESAMGRK